MHVPHFPFVIAILLAACSSGGGDDPGVPDVGQPEASPIVRMRFSRDDSFYSAPFPSDDLRAADGHVSLAKFPNPRGIDLVKQSIGLIERDTRGFGTSSAIYFQLTKSLSEGVRAALPTLSQSIAKDASVYLFALDHPELRMPIEVAFSEDEGPFGDLNLLSLLPLQGVPLRASTTYAAVVTKKIASRAPELDALIVGTKPDGLSDAVFASYRRAIDVLKADVDQAAGLAVFTTDDPTSTLQAVLKDASARPLPLPKAVFTKDETFDDYCVFHSTIAMPVYQAGTPPYRDASQGGGFTFDASGKPIFQRDEESNFVVTIPRGKVPAKGLPTVVFIRTGGGGDRPLVDRGVHAVAHGDAVAAGSGPAHDFAQVGFAGVSVDGPHGGLRNVTHGDEQFLMFNVANAMALRDNVRQSAMEVALLTQILAKTTIDASSCPGVVDDTGAPATSVKFGQLALMGHSMGATIAPLSVAISTDYGALVLSGAGGSWIENVLYKKQPLEVGPIVEVLLGYVNFDRKVTAHDPALTLFQWATESSDPQVYDRYVSVDTPFPAHHVLMLQGIVDHYIMPPIANTTSLSLGLDLGGPSLDESVPEIAMLPSLRSLLPFSGRQTIALPASGNHSGDFGHVTAVVVQHAADGIEDGHEVVFQTEAPKHQYRCFLASWLKSGVPIVVPDGREEDPCE